LFNVFRAGNHHNIDSRLAGTGKQWGRGAGTGKAVGELNVELIACEVSATK